MHTLGQVRQCFALLSQRERPRVRLYVVIQVLLAFADLVGVTLLGLVTIIATGTHGRLVDAVLGAFPDDWDDDVIALVLAGSALLIFTIKAVLAIVTNRWMLGVLAHREANLTADAVTRVLENPIMQVDAVSSQATIFAVTNGAEFAVSRVVSQSMMALGECVLLVVLLAGLLIVNFAATALLTVYLVLVLVVLQRFIMRRAAAASRRDIETSVTATRLMQESLLSYRELFVTRKIAPFAEAVLSNRAQGARARSAQQLLAQLPKYLLELAMLYGVFLVALIQYVRVGADGMFSTVGVLLAGGFRLMPSILRLQNCALSVKASLPFAEQLFALLRALDKSESGRVIDELDEAASSKLASQSALPPTNNVVELVDVSFRYPTATRYALESVTLRIERGERVALVGRSGSGKSTLVDLVLGLLEPESGAALLFGGVPRQVLGASPGLVGFVPQTVAFFNGTLAENVALATARDEVDEGRVTAALAAARLDDVVTHLPAGHWTQVGEAARRLSGGQRQRIGIARALYSQPKLLVLDEATSALDTETERSINTTIAALGDEMTVLTIAHRPATIRSSRRVIVLSEGRLVGDGSYNALHEQFAYLGDLPDDRELPAAEAWRTPTTALADVRADES